MKFAPFARTYGDQEFSVRCELEARRLQENIEKNAWDGEWYRRAYFDDGTPLGTAQGVDCKIDSLSQSWSVLSGAGDSARSRMAMEGVEQRLVRREHGIIQLLDPPFDQSDLNPGYIRGYVPGIRENGGQYTHAAIWTAMAFAEMGERQKAFELLQMINPVNHSRSEQEANQYKVEPYVITADIYGVEPHTGRGGWSWYTGSSGWFYRMVIESILGVKMEGNKLTIKPWLPEQWPWCQIKYLRGDALYIIYIERAEKDRRPAEFPETTEVLLDKGAGEHTIRIFVA